MSDHEADIVPIKKDDPFTLKQTASPRPKPGRPKKADIEKGSYRTRQVAGRISASLVDSAEIYVFQVPSWRYITDFMEFAFHYTLTALDEQYPDRKVHDLLSQYNAKKALSDFKQKKEEDQDFLNDAKQQWKNSTTITSKTLIYNSVHNYLPECHDEVYEAMVSFNDEMKGYIGRSDDT